ncbi:MAG: hypothetical protein R3E89_06525 [Thiolinea sp.]
MDAERINRLFTVNVTSCFLCCREAIKRMGTAYGDRGVPSSMSHRPQPASVHRMNTLIMPQPRRYRHPDQGTGPGSGGPGYPGKRGAPRLH